MHLPRVPDMADEPAEPAALQAPSAEASPRLRDFARRAGLAVAIAAAIVSLVALFVLGIEIVLAAFAGVLFATLLRALTLGLTALTGMPDGWGLAVVLVLLVVLIGGSGALLAPRIADQLDDIGDRLPGMIDDVEELVRGIPAGDLILEQARAADAGQAAAGAAEGVARTIPDWFYYALTAFFVGLFGAVNPVLYQRATANIFPLHHRARVLHLLEETGYTLRWWLLGQAASMVLIGSSTWLLLLAFGLPLAGPVGILVGLLGFIPYLGPILGIAPVALVAGTAGATTFLLVMGGYVLIQNLEGYVALPLIHQKTVYLPPAFTIIVQMLLGTLVGALGFVMATPAAVIALVLIRFYRRYALDDREVERLGR